ncbi:MAG: hypothetical protein R3E50_06325 [Halioglobus sp.]
MIGARGDEVHAIEFGADAVARHAVNRRQAGQAAGTAQAHARYIAQQAGRVAGAGRQRRYRAASDARFADDNFLDASIGRRLCQGLHRRGKNTGNCQCGWLVIQRHAAPGVVGRL